MQKKKYTKMASVLLSEETYRQLVKATKEKEMSISAFVREILEMLLDEKPTDKNTNHP